MNMTRALLSCFATLGLLAATAAAGPYAVAVEGESHEIGSTIRVRAAAPKRDPAPDLRAGFFGPGAPQGTGFVGVQGIERSEFEMRAPTAAGAWTVRLLDPDGKVAAEAAVRIEARRAPGALAVAEGPYAIGAPITVAVKIPDGIYRDGGAWVGLFRPAYEAPGGARVGEERVAWQRAGESMAFAAPDWPGTYEFRLFDRDANEYEIDRAGIRVEAPAAEGALRLPKERFVAGEAFDLAVALPDRRTLRSPWVELVRAADGGGAFARRPVQRIHWRHAESGALRFTAPEWPGRYEFRLFDREIWDDAFELGIDRIAFEVFLPRAPETMRLPKERFAVGERIEIAVRLPEGRYLHNPWIGLYRTAVDVPGGARLEVSHLATRAAADGTVLFDAPEWPGRYEFRFFDRDLWDDSGEYGLDRVAFETYAPAAPGALRLPKQVFEIGERIEVQVALPGNRYLRNPWIGLFNIDAPAEGEAPRQSALHRAEPATEGTVVFVAPNATGRFELRLFDRDIWADAWEYRLDQVSFETVAKPARGAMRIAKEEYAAGETIEIELVYPEGRFRHQPWIGLFHSITRTPEGAVRDLVRRKDAPAENGIVRFAAPEWPGEYEFRLYDRAGDPYLIDRAAFRSVVPAAPGALRLPKKTFAVGEPLELAARMPAGRYAHSPRVKLYRRGSTTAGGSVLPWLELGEKEVGEGVVAWNAPPHPGAYEFRLFDRASADYAIDRAPFDVEAPPAKGSLALTGAEFAPGDPLPLASTLPKGRYLNRPWVGLFRIRQEVPGGGAMAEIPAGDQAVEEGTPLALRAPRAPGLYEARLFDRAGNGYLLDAAPFRVRGAESVAAPLPVSAPLPHRPVDEDAGGLRAAEAEKAADSEIAAEKKKQEEEWDKLDGRMKWLSLFLNQVPSGVYEALQGELNEILEKKDPALLRELLATDRKGLAGFLNRHPEIFQAFEEYGKPSFDKATSALGSYLSLERGMRRFEEGKYADAASAFVDAGLSSLKVLPKSLFEKMQEKLGKQAEPGAAFLKNVIGLAQELSREKTAAAPLDPGVVMKETAGLLANGFLALNPVERQRVIDSLGRFAGPLKALGGDYGGRIVGMLDAAPEIYRLFADWDTGNRWVAMSNAAQKVGPKAVGALVQAWTRSSAAGDAAEFLAQQGADYLGGLGKEARESWIAAANQAMDASRSESERSALLRKLSTEAGLTEREAQAFDNLASAAGGVRTGDWLSVARRAGRPDRLREALAAHRRAERETGGALPGVRHAIEQLNRTDADPSLRRAILDKARLSVRVLARLETDYAPGSAGREFLAALRADLEELLRTFG